MLPENFKIQRDRNYETGNRNLIVPSDTKFRVLADTGWFDWQTNLDAEPDKQYTARYRVVLMPGGTDPIVITEHFGAAQSGGSFTMSGGFEKAKDTTPYLHHSRRIIHAVRFSDYLTGSQKKDWLHPRFTPIKEWMRMILAIEKKRSEYTGKARKKAAAEAAKKFTYNIPKEDN